MSEPQTPRILDARIEAEKIRTMYKDDLTQRTFKALVLGEKGTGKTRLLQTARLPVHIDSFDTGGTQTLEDIIKRGDIIADTRYEADDPLGPFAFSEWRRNMEQRMRGKYFESLGTYCLDSCTTWSDSIMYWVQDQAEKADKTGKLKILGTAPRRNHDYAPQKVQIGVWLKRILSLPCDVIVTGHLYGVYESTHLDDGTVEERLVAYRFMSTGKGTVTIPLPFSEMWVMRTKPSSRGAEYQILTGRSGLYQGTTRIGREGRFELFEPADVKKLLKKAGWPTADKEKL